MNIPKFDINKIIEDFNEYHKLQLEFNRYAGGQGYQLFIKGKRSTGLKCSKNEAIEIVNFLKEISYEKEIQL